MIKEKNFLPQLFILIAGIILFFPFLGSVHLFDWDEINFAESAREMIISGDYLNVQINYLPFWEKPPLFIWMQVLSMKLFGINEFAARFPNAIAGISTLLILYHIGRKLYDNRFGIIWALVYAGSLLPHMYFKSGIIDPWFNLFIFLGIYYMVSYTNPDDSRNEVFNIVMSAIFIGLGINTKGPVALLLFGLTVLVWVVYSKQWKVIFNFRFLLLYILVVSIVGGLWFLLLVLKGNSYVIIDFFQYQIRLFTQEDAGHGGFLLYHFVVLFIGVFPASVFALRAFKKFTVENGYNKLFNTWMMITFWVVLILFTLVNTKIIHYSSMCYFPLTFFAALIIFKIIRKEISFPSWQKVLLIIMTIFVGGLLIVVQLFIKYKDKILASGIIKDDFAVENMQAMVNWTGFEFLIGVILIGGIIGSLWIFRKNMQYQIAGIFLSSIIFVNITMTIIVPRVEQYSQNAALEFYRNISSEECYVETWGFKSYAQYFYFNKPVPTNENSQNNDWLLTGEVDKPVYIVTKNINANDFKELYPEFSKLYEKNGFVFFVRK